MLMAMSEVVPTAGGGLPISNEERRENFLRWFGESKVVDKEGKPLVVYHGTSSDFSQFRPNFYGDRFHFGTVAQAEQRAGDAWGGYAANVIPVYLSIRNPLRLPDLNQWANKSSWAAARKSMPPKVSDMVGRVLNRESTDRFTFLNRIVEILESAGYDGIVYQNQHEGGDKADSWMAFRPEQIKSAIGNSGRFDPQSASLTDEIESPLTVATIAPNRGRVRP